MLLATSNRARRLLCVSYIGQVRRDELARRTVDIQSLLAELPPGFRLLVDLSGLESMDPDCRTEIGRMMDLIDQSGVGLVVRVIPNPARDIGLNILGIFHYPHRPQIITCASLTEAGQHLA